MYRIVQCVVVDPLLNQCYVTFVDKQGIREMAEYARDIDDFFPSSLTNRYNIQELGLLPNPD